VFGHWGRVLLVTLAAYAAMGLLWGATRAGRWVAARYAKPRQSGGPEADYHDPIS
jgi:hypothetical protein